MSQKEAKKIKKCKMPIGIAFIHNVFYITYKPYRIHYFNHIYVIAGYSQPQTKGNKRGQKG